MRTIKNKIKPQIAVVVLVQESRIDKVWKYELLDLTGKRREVIGKFKRKCHAESAASLISDSQWFLGMVALFLEQAKFSKGDALHEALKKTKSRLVKSKWK